jgi:hypothetical protein
MGVDALAESAETAVTMTATYVHRHVAEFLHDLKLGRTIEVVDKKYGDRIVKVRDVQDA